MPPDPSTLTDLAVDGPPAVDGPTASADPRPHTEDGRQRPGLRRWYLFWPTVAYVGVRVLTLVALVVIDRITHVGLEHRLFRWDSRWFVWTAEQGYPRTLPMVDGHVAGNTIAFFPVYPGVVRWVAHLTSVSTLVVAGVISAVTGLTATLAVGRLVRAWAGTGPATRAALLFAVFPGTFVFSLMYSEGIVITCLALGLLALLRRRWWLAGLLGMVATATTPIALAFVLSCAWCAVAAIRRDRAWRALLAPVLAPLGFLVYMAWLWAHTGQLDAWRLTEKGGWQSYPSLVYPFHIVATFLFDPVRPTITGQLLMAGIVFTVVAAVLAIRQRQPAPVLLYGLAAAGMAALAAPVGLRPRFVMLAFPLVVAVATRLHGRAYTAVVVLSCIGLFLMTWLEVFSYAVFP
jgi:hypothetical protein